MSRKNILIVTKKKKEGGKKERKRQLSISTEHVEVWAIVTSIIMHPENLFSSQTIQLLR